MFADALERAAVYTRPVVLSQMTKDKKCGSGIGAFVVINRDGWALTAAHIVKDVIAAAQSAHSHALYDQAVAAIESDATLDRSARRAKLRALVKPPTKSPCATSSWWAWDDATLDAYAMIEDVDLAVVRIGNFDPARIAVYPKLKDPATPLRPGTSLCRLGYPFHAIQPTFDEGTSVFHLPPGSVPPPLFAVEGMLNRFSAPMDIRGRTRTIPGMFFETSSPGLRGQSGGPIFDRNGVVYGIQSHTVHFPLGFSPPVPGGKPDQHEHQFLNVGRGIHPATIVSTLEDMGVAFELAA